MLRLSIDYLQPGMQLGRDIYGEDGRVILAAGATLTDKYIEVLRKWLIRSVYVFNPIISVPPHVLAKRDSDQLTPEERDLLQGHAAAGFALLRKLDGVPLLAAHIAYQHHEKWQGQGYPRKLAGADIHELSRIVAVTNAYDNLIADSPGKPGMPPHLAYEAIVSGVNVEFDAALAEAFLTRIALYPVGTMVQLTSGHIGVVTAVTPKMQHRPIIDIITDENRRLLAASYGVNLAAKEYLTVFIQDVVSDQTAMEFLENNQGGV